MANDALGIVFPNTYDSVLSEITAIRAMGSVPFGGGYRLIDFTLSNMVNSGMQKIGVITKNNYQSLMDHLGNGRPWDLSRKYDGLFILPPFNNSEGAGVYNNRIAALKNVSQFISMSHEEYVIISDCESVCNMDFGRLLDFHKAKNADITVVYKHGRLPKFDDLMVLRDMDEDGRVRRIDISPSDEEGDFSFNIIVMAKALLQRLVNDAASRGDTFFERDIFQRNVDLLKIYGCEVEGFSPVIDGLVSYYNANMMLLDKANRDSLFTSERPIYTKVRDDMTAVYGEDGGAVNSLISDGAVIDGRVENSIIYRNVRIGRGAVVRNSIIMAGASVAEGTMLNCVIADKNVTVSRRRELSGADNFPIYIGKNITV